MEGLERWKSFARTIASSSCSTRPGLMACLGSRRSGSPPCSAGALPASRGSRMPWSPIRVITARVSKPFLRPGTPIQVEPIFSNIGEPDTVPAFAEREPICVLFGRGGTRRRTYERFRRYFDELRLLGIERLIEIGVEPEITAGLEWPFPVERLGRHEATEISSIMARARYGLFQCPVHIAGKSGVLAALAAHGVLPIHPDGEGMYDATRIWPRHSQHLGRYARARSAGCSGT